MRRHRIHALGRGDIRLGVPPSGGRVHVFCPCRLKAELRTMPKLPPNFLDCGGKRSATPLSWRCRDPKRCRRCPPSAVLLRRTGALPPHSKIPAAHDDPRDFTAKARRQSFPWRGLEWLEVNQSQFAAHPLIRRQCQKNLMVVSIRRMGKTLNRPRCAFRKQHMASRFLLPRQALSPRVRVLFSRVLSISPESVLL